MKKELRTAIDDIKRGKIDPLYFFHGEETFLIEEALSKIKESFRNDGLDEFNFNVFDAQTATPHAVIDSAETFPFGKKRRLLIIKHFESVTAQAGQIYEKYFKHPSSFTVMAVTADKIDARKNVFKTLFETAVSVETARVKESMLPQWIRYLAQKEQIELSNECILHLQNIRGGSLLEIQSEIQKIAAYSGSRERITLTDLETLSPGSRLHSIFELTDALGERNNKKAFILFEQMSNRSDDILPITAMLSRHIRTLLRLKTSPNPHSLKIPAFLAGKLQSQASLFTKKQLLAVSKTIEKADLDIKTRNIQDKAALMEKALLDCIRMFGG